jgi:hypothetical protein
MINMSASRLKYLFFSYVQNNFTVQEEEEFMGLLTQPESQAEVQKLIDQVIENTGAEMQMNAQVAASILDNIFQRHRHSTIPVKQKRML